jgi:hypothetical protein
MLIYVAVSGDSNMIKKEAEKIIKIKISTEIWRMWNVQAKVIPVITWAPGTISESFRQKLTNIPGKHETYELVKTPILGSAHILQKVLM